MFRNKSLKVFQAAKNCIFRQAFSSIPSKFSEIDVSSVEINQLSNKMIEYIKQQGNKKETFQINQKLIDALYQKQNIDQVILCQQLIQYNQYLFQNYMKYYFRVRLWNPIYDKHFISIQTLAYKILYQSFISDPKNDVFVKEIPTYLIEQDIKKLFGFKEDINSYENFIKRNEMVTELTKQYPSIQFLDYMQLIQIYKSGNQAYLEVQHNNIFYHTYKTTLTTIQIFDNILDYTINIISIMVIMITLFIVYHLNQSQEDTKNNKKVKICRLCSIKGFFLREQNFKLCEECQKQIDLQKKQEAEQGFFRKIWNKISSSN